MASILEEFKEFIARGNVVDLAVGVVVGGAFQKIVSSLVDDVIMPPLGLLLKGINFTDIKILLQSGQEDAHGKIIAKPVSINIGNFIQTTIDFLILAAVIFLFVKLINIMKRKHEAAHPPEPSNQEKVLGEIRDLIKNGQAKIEVKGTGEGEEKK
jgi:large conductance mechanosensitive channel